VKRAIWCEYWQGRIPKELFTDLHSTYPHTCMIAEKLMGAPSFYLGEPSVIVFNNGESWADVKPLVTMLRYPALVRFYRKLGLPADRARACERRVFEFCEPLLAGLLRGEASPQTPSISTFLRANWRSAEAWRALARAIRLTGEPPIISKLLSIANFLKAHRDYAA
jgi:hypothetical protein